LGALGGRLGGVGGVDRKGIEGADGGGNGGAEGGVGTADVCLNPEGFLAVGNGGFLPGGGGLGFEEMSTIDIAAGLKLPFRLATEGITGAEGAAPGGRGGAEPGKPGTRGALPCGLGAIPGGGRDGELRVVSGSDMYEELLSAPVSMPAPCVFRSLGIPPANKPASCGGAPPDPVSPLSLLLLALFGVGGASPPGGGGGAPPGEGLLAMPGIGGAPMTGAGALSVLPTMGADLSLICVTFLSLAPPSMLLRSAPYNTSDL
jgi:hypothetical protein